MAGRRRARSFRLARLRRAFTSSFSQRRRDEARRARSHSPRSASPKYGPARSKVIRALAPIVGALGALAAGMPTGAAARPPNVVLIVADDLGYADLGCYGQQWIATPCIDRMASEGTRFTHCYAGAPVCAPSRCTLMTGLHTGHARIRDNAGHVGGVPDEETGTGHRIPLVDADETIAETLQRAGYATGATGKWGLGEAGTPGVPTRQGFEAWYGYLNQNHAVHYFTDYLWRNETKAAIEANTGRQRRVYSHDLMADFALEFIRSRREVPFFLYVPFTIPHADLEAPDLGPYGDKEWPVEAKTMAAMITRMDRDVGRLLDLLEELELDKDTIVLFCSDNGSPCAGGALFNSCGNLRGRKGELTEGGLRVPMIARWPGRIPAKRTNDAPWTFADMLPTLCDLTGVAAPANVDGQSVAPLLWGEIDALSDRFLYWEIPPPRFQQAARHGPWKALRAGRDQRLQLYHLIDDPSESHDVAAQHPAIVKMFEDYLSGARTPSPHWPE